MNKTLIVRAITDALRQVFENLCKSSKQTRSAGNDAETKAEGKYDTRSTEENYLADGLARLAQEAAQAVEAYESFPIRAFDSEEPVDVGALVLVKFPDASEWFFLGPAGGGTEVLCDGKTITVLTPESPLGQQLIGLRAGDTTGAPRASVEKIS